MLLAIRESGTIAARQVTVLRLAQGAAFDVSGDVALNTAHRTGDGSDHADVASNSAFIDPEGYNNSPLKAVLDLADIISIETSTGGVFSKVKATLQILKDLIGGGGGGGAEFTEIQRELLSGPVSVVNFTGLLASPYDEFRLRYYNLGDASGSTTLLIRFGNAGTYAATGYKSHIEESGSFGAGYSGATKTSGIPIADILALVDRTASGSVIIDNARNAAELTSVRGGGILNAITASFSTKQDPVGSYGIAETHSDIQVAASAGDFSKGLLILEGRTI